MASIATPVRQAPLVTQVAEQFTALLKDGTWPVGSKIPGENQLATDLGVSRGTVREALRALSLSGLLDPRVGDGTYVRATDELTAILTRDQVVTDLAHALDVRSVLETAAARRAAQHATPEHVAALDEALAARQEAHDRGDRDAYVAADIRFHRGVIEASGNPLLVRLYDAIAQTMTETISQTAVLPEDPIIERSHRQLRQAIADHEPDAAERIATELIDDVTFLSAIGGPAS
ncbi:FadR/GntR family transcriptional regulator [Plantibacter sp. YIM 135249]|uniref:FadR/GntR family transcriptional regulator n=1 Tax=Plantibacter sp. YIM 135249 TaxID=3423918 RepID=UPI003D34DB47